MDDMSLAAELVREAGTLAASRCWPTGLETEYKTSVSDVVSAADHAAEELVTARLAEHRGRRRAGRRGGRPAGPATAGPGTSTRSTGRTTSSPACPTGARRSGWPTRTARWSARSTSRRWTSCGSAAGTRRPPSTAYPWPELVDRPLADVSVATYFHPRHLGDQDRLTSWQAVTAGAATVRMLGSASVDLAGVASGRLGIFLQANLHPWDWVPGAALVHRGRRGGRGVRRSAASAGRSPATVSRLRTPAALRRAALETGH